EYFRHVERIAAGSGMQARCRTSKRLRELFDRRLRQRSQWQAPHRFPWQKPDSNLQRMSRVNLVSAVGDDQRGACAPDAPAEVLHPVERLVIRPMHVLADRNPGLPPTL